MEIIVFMGATGSGKSSLIRLATGDESVAIGNGLESTTKTVDSYEFTFGGLRHVLVDTPGFDDNTVSDQDILADICTWLSSSHGEDARVSAIIYMHRITDTRIQGSAMSNFHRFSRLCGKDSLSRVSLCTTFWDIYGPDPGAAEARFQQLQQPEFWGKMVQKGSTIYKAPSTQRQAREFVHSLANRRPVISDAEAPEETAEMLDLKQLMEQREQYDGKLLEAKRQLEQEMAKRAESEAKRLEALQQAFEEKLKIQNLAKEKAEAEIAQLHRKMSEQTQKNNNLMKQAENIRVRRTRTDVVDKFQQAVVARQRKFDQFMVNVATSARILQTGKQNKHVKCDIATTKQCYTVVCNHCLQNIGSRPYYVCDRCSNDQNTFILCWMCFSDNRVLCNDALHNKSLMSKRNSLDALTSCPRAVVPPQNRQLRCVKCRQDVGICYLHCCNCSEAWDLCVNCAVKGKYCKGHKRSFPRTAHELQMCFRYLGNG